MRAYVRACGGAGVHAFVNAGVRACVYARVCERMGECVGALVHVHDCNELAQDSKPRWWDSNPGPLD